MKTRLLWILPATLLAIVLGTLLALPGFVAAQDHRAAVERFAGVLTGRNVRIAGPVSLMLLPRPELQAAQITIEGPDHERISAATLKLDISLAGLLHGQLAAQTLDLDSPIIAFPWPLPGGPLAISPPGWLAALHAHLHHASISLGALLFTDVDADLFTSTGGGVSLSGTGMIDGTSLTLSVALGQSALDGTAPLAVEANAGAASLRFTGSLNGQGETDGQISGALPGNILFNASLTANGNAVQLAKLAASRGAASLTGDATLDLHHPDLQAALIGQNLDIDALTGELGHWPPGLKLDLSLNASNVTVWGNAFPALMLDLYEDEGGVEVPSFTLSLPGGGALSGVAGINAGALRGQLALSVPDLTALLAAKQLPPLPGWGAVHMTATLGGTPANQVLQNLAGTLGPDRLSGNLILMRGAGQNGGPGFIAGALDFSHLPLSPLAAWLRLNPGKFPALDVEISAARAEAGPMKLTHLALDAALDGGLNLRRASADLYGGLAAGSLALNRAGQVMAAHGFIDIPSATPLAALLPPGLALPPALAALKLSVVFAASGPANALAASAVARLGDFTITAAPVIDLNQQSASGALTMEHPQATQVARYFGLDQGLIFPGAGSASMRATFTASASTFGLNDFILSFGALSAQGRIMADHGVVSGMVDASTLALPPLPANFLFPDNLPLQGNLALHADQVVYAGQPLVGPSAMALSWGGGGATVTLDQAMFGQGSLAGSLSMELSASKAPAFTGKLMAKNIDASAIALPLSFPYPIMSGTLNATAGLNASGYGLKSLLATLGGTVDLSASKGVLRGFSLAGFAGSLGQANEVKALYHALISGSTSFDGLNLAASLAQGNCTLKSASLTGPAGHVSASGGIDLFDQAQALRLIISPAVKPPVQVTLVVLGSWAAPRHIAHMKQALMWKPAKNPP